MSRSSLGRKVGIVLVVIVMWLCGGWWMIGRAVNATFPRTPVTAANVAALPAKIDALLKLQVDARGMVDYVALRRDPRALHEILGLLRDVSPQSHPHFFPTREAKLAYWINAYNVSILQNVLLFPAWKDIFSYLRKARFFYLSRYTYGGQTWNLYNLENKWIRPQFKEARIHFALNCASFGCPKLPREAFRAKTLDIQLEREARRFVSESRNVQVDTKSRTIHLSSIFDWFRGDFAGVWLQKTSRQPSTLSSDVVLLRYINRFRKAGAALPTKGYRVVFMAYDWRINDQQGPSREMPLSR